MDAEGFAPAHMQLCYIPCANGCAAHAHNPFLRGAGVADPALEEDHASQAVLNEEQEGAVQSEKKQIISTYLHFVCFSILHVRIVYALL